MSGKSIIKYYKQINAQTKYGFWIVFVFTLTRLYFYSHIQSGFNYKVLNYLIQYVDPVLLKNNLPESLFYLHSQPPLFNFLIGVSEIIFGANANNFNFLLFVFTGLLTSLMLFNLMFELKVKNWLNFVITIIYLITPATILYENFFFYTHLVIYFFISAAYFLIRYSNTRKKIYLHFFFLFLLLISLTTSFFHIVWFIFSVIGLLYFYKESRKAILTAALIPFIILFSLYFKNFLVFGDFNTSSWFGMNLSRITVFQMPAAERIKLIGDGKLSEVAGLAPFPHQDVLWNLKTIKPDTTGIIILDQINKKSGRTNFNNNVYIKISKAAFNDSKFIIINYPQYYWRGIKKAFEIYFKPPTQYKLLNQDLFAIKTFNKFFNAFFYGASPNTPFGYYTLFLTIFIILSTVFLLLKNKPNENAKAVLMFMLLNIIYVMIVGNFLEVGENNRFRFYTEIFSYILFANILNELLSFLQKKSSRLSTGHSS